MQTICGWQMRFAQPIKSREQWELGGRASGAAAGGVQGGLDTEILKRMEESQLPAGQAAFASKKTAGKRMNHDVEVQTAPTPGFGWQDQTLL